ncbi:MAG: tetratricopeptide repeat protein [Phycisphaerae bacterium]|nr:tetratricopeptide repeat protein [Phycisphaerae bacterium]
MKPSPAMISICSAIALVVAAGTVYFPVLTAGFANQTDHLYLYEAGSIWSPEWSWADAGRTFSRDRIHRPDESGGYYQPLTALSIRLDGWIAVKTSEQVDVDAAHGWASRAFQFHLTNMVLHILNTLLIFVIVRRLSGSVIWPILLSCVFAFHPVQVESVTWIAQRMTLLGGFFALLSLWCYLRSFATQQRSAWIGLATILYAAAMLSRPIFIALPVIMLTLDVWPYRRTGWVPLMEKLPMLTVSLLSGAMQVIARADAGIPPARDAAVAFGPAHAFASLVARLFWPINLTPYNPASASVGGIQLGAWFDVLVVVAVLVAAVIAFRRSKPFFVALSGGVLFVAPALLEWPYARLLLSDQYLYAVLIVPLIVLAAWLGRRGPVWQWWWGRWTAIGTAAFVLIFAVHSHAQTWVWQSSRDLHEHTVRIYPNWIHAHLGLVESLIQENEFDAALVAARRAAQRNPDHPSVQFYLGTILLLNNDSRAGEAAEMLRAALKSNPDWIECLQNLGVAMARSGQNEEAIKYLERARDLQPASSGIRLGLGHAYLKVQRFASARAEFQEALRRRNDPMAHLGLAIAWAANDEMEFARRHLEAAVAKDPNYARRAGRSPELLRLRDFPGFGNLIESPADSSPEDLHATEAPAATRAHGL